MKEKCLCEPNDILIFSCAGSSNIGQIANYTGVKLTQAGISNFFLYDGNCGVHVTGMIESL